MTVDQWFAVATVVSVVGGAVGVVIHGARTGLGWFGLLPWSRRRQLERALRAIDIGMTLDAFISTLGHKPTRAKRWSSGLMHRFSCRDVDVLVFCDDDGVVYEYKVLARNVRFHPRINIAPRFSGAEMVICLGRTRFAEVGTPDAVCGSNGIGSYGELHHGPWFGVRGWFIFGTYTAQYSSEDYWTMLQKVGFSEEDVDPFQPTPALDNPTLQTARTNTPIFTYTVMEQLIDGSGWF